MDEHQIIVREAEEKEKAKNEAQVTLESRKLLFPLDLSITPKAFKFRNSVKVVNVPAIDRGSDHLIFLFYLKHIKSRYKTWSASKIKAMKITGPIEIDSFTNVKVYKSTLADMRCLNSYDWIMLYNFLLRDEQKYEPIVAHLKQMLISYIEEFGKMEI
ncbi:unnamed protein product [Lactuca saligna]|uniref:Uncharacterized protein n=1 Tax=Lactuca saligna TaxID=75948 RepID=A0AA35Z9A4_LACSI|nr:unnamed protein product [Lactuca saligna]